MDSAFGFMTTILIVMVSAFLIASYAGYLTLYHYPAQCEQKGWMGHSNGPCYNQICSYEGYWLEHGERQERKKADKITGTRKR